ncbi:hypothetical protein MKW98_013061 [Papaver atlanticum]|uniref:30S ribosomal protein S15 n=1 Tax=Papaver atlanticum TaxID=357466 RepID=A0AAD4SJ61_9MAGN|nr:hypothetical protein MKW98_013061 [Papaver atlanticum]
MASILSTSAFLQTPASLSTTPLETPKGGVFSLSFRNRRTQIGSQSNISNLFLNKSNTSTLEVSRFIPSAVYQQTSEVEEAKEEKTGSVEFQVLCFTNKIRSLTSHLQTHRKDYSSQRGLRLTLGKRQRLLAYLAKKDSRRYMDLIGRLDIRDPKKTRATLN